MAFIIHGSQKARRFPDMRLSSLGFAWSWLVMALLLAAPAHAANFSVKTVQSYITERVLHVNARLDLPLNSAIEEALGKGIPIDVVIEINMLKHRWWWRNLLITDQKLRRRIQFHALSRQYLVSGLRENDASESFGSLSQALAHAGTLDDFTMTLTAKKDINPNARYLLQLRAHLDIETLPTLMRPLAYATPAWRLNTGWTKWPIQFEQP
jgi:hypothetical protein